MEKRAADVVIAGGGIAGVSAALAAARNGAKVLLIEKQCILGGLATAGLVAIYLPLCDGMGHQISYGIAEELFHLSIREGGMVNEPKAWLHGGTLEERKKHRFEVQFNPQMMALLTEELLLEHGVEVLYDTYISGVQTENGKIASLQVENKSGKTVIKGKTFIDTTGDAQLFYLAGCSTRTHEEKNGVAAWYYHTGRDGYRLRILGECDSVLETEGGNKMALEKRRFSGLDGRENSELLCASHRATLNDIRKHRKQDETYEPVTLATMPQLRMTRCFQGAYMLKETENGKRFSDSIGMVADWRKKGMIYEIPFRCLYSETIRNLAGAGRCISVDDGMWDISRVIPACAVTGEAVGTAAAMTEDFTGIDVENLQKVLERQGQKCHFSQLGL